MRQNLQNLFLGTFDEENKVIYNEFRKVQLLLKEKTPLKDIHKTTGICYNRLYNWVRKNPSVPSSVRCFEKAMNRRYFNLDENRLEILAYLVGYVFGDGSISRDKCNVWFYGVSTDLPKINIMLKGFQVKGTIRVYIIDNGKMVVCDNAFTRLLISLGAPIGDKTKQVALIPSWVLCSSKRVKVKFLQGIFDSELSCLQKIYDDRLPFQSLKFYTSRETTQIEGGICFLNQIRKILSEFDVTTSDIKKDRTYARSDGTIATQLYFVIHSNYVNLYKFISHIGFLTNSKRRKSVLVHSKDIENVAKSELEKIEKYKQCLELRKRGMSAYKVANNLSIPTHLVKSWFYKNRKPRLFNSIKDGKNERF